MNDGNTHTIPDPLFTEIEAQLARIGDPVEREHLAKQFETVKQQLKANIGAMREVTERTKVATADVVASQNRLKAAMADCQNGLKATMADLVAMKDQIVAMAPTVARIGELRVALEQLAEIMPGLKAPEISTERRNSPNQP